MQLSKDERIALETLTKSPGYAVLKKIEEDARVRLGNAILDANLSDPDTLAKLRENQIYAKARTDFLDNVEAHVRTVYEPNVDQPVTAS